MKYTIPQQLLFFRFKEFKKYNKVLLTNIVWDHLILEKEEFNKVVKWDFSDNLQDKLEKAGFWKNDETIKNTISAYRNKHKYLSWWPTLHILVVTQWCNLNCIYCHSKTTWKDIHKYVLTKEIADKYLDIIFSSPADFLTIEFQWWEPTVAWDMIKYIVKNAQKLAKEKNKKIKFTTTTNLYEITEEQINFMFENDFSINTSVDWVSNIHNETRPAFPNGKSFEKIEKNIKLIQNFEKKYNKKLLSWWIAVITKYNLKNPELLAQQYKNLDLNFVLVKYLDWLGRSEVTKEFIWYTAEEFVNFYKKHLEEVKKINLEGYKLIDGFVHIFIKKILAKENPNYVDLQNPCGASIGQVAYNWNWEIYTCDEWRTLDTDIFKVWDYKNTNNIKEIIQNETTASVCNCSCLESNVCDMCVYQPYCWICPVHNYINHGEIFVDIRKTFRHKFNSFIQDFVFEKIITEDKQWLKIFENWLK